MSQVPSVTLQSPAADIAQLVFDTPDKSANILSASVLDELSGHLDELESRQDLAGLIISSGKPGTFIAGADLREFAASMDIPPEKTKEMCRRGQALFGRLSRLPLVTVAAIDGICVGGGAEMAVWCDRRIMSRRPATQIGFPEVKLGLFPGWGGTARTPRIIGLANAVEMITSGESIDAEDALAMGLVSDLVEPDQLLDAAIRLVRAEQSSGAWREDRRRWSGPLTISETELGFLGATASAVIQQKTKGQYPAPMAALQLMAEGSMIDVEQALEMEAEGMAQLFGTPINAALINVFFLTDRNKKDRGVDRADIQPQGVSLVGVVGAGIMGAGIAAANVKRDVSCVLTDASAEALEQGVLKTLEEVAYNKKTKGPDVERALKYAPRLHSVTRLAELGMWDVVVVAIVEKADAKRRLFAELEPLLPEHAVLASNTSTIPISSLAKDLQRRERFCGIHFFNPVRRMQLVEVIRGDQTSDTSVATAVAYAKQIKKMPIVVGDGPGFLVNRLLFPYMGEALELLCDGASIKAVDRAAKRFGMPMGPIELYDMVGLDTALMAGRTMWEAFPERIVASPLLPALVKSGRLGQKNGRGFFNYQNSKGKPEPDSEIDQFIERYRRQQAEFTEEQITNRLFMPMLLEATRVLQESIVRDVRDVDLGLIFGLGFPPFKGGLLWWADTVGAATILEMLKPLETLGKRMEPTPLLTDLAQAGDRFYNRQS
jgi:3-hydroxyacyl-CoA dehydrogenase/enoyl-CoA hydratase/carnithine racemase